MELLLASAVFAALSVAAVRKSKRAVAPAGGSPAPPAATGGEASHLPGGVLEYRPPPVPRPPVTASPPDAGALGDVLGVVKDAKTVAGIASTVGTVAAAAGIDASASAIGSGLLAAAPVAVPLAAIAAMGFAIFSDIFGPSDAERWRQAEWHAENDFRIAAEKAAAAGLPPPVVVDAGGTSVGQRAGTRNTNW